MVRLQHLVRVVRIGAIVLPVTAGIGYALVYGTDHWFKLGCGEQDPVLGNHLLASVWLVLAGCQAIGFSSPPRGVDLWKVIVIAVSALGIYACWDLYVLPPLWDNCQNIGVYDYADDFLVVDGVLIVLCIPATAVSGCIALLAAVKWQLRKDAGRASS